MQSHKAIFSCLLLLGLLCSCSEPAQQASKAQDVDTLSGRSTKDYTLQRIDSNYNFGLAVLADEPKPISEFVRRIFQDSQDRFWYGSNGDGLIRNDGDSLLYLSIDDGLAGRAVRGIVEDVEGHLWIATEGGVSKYDGQEFFNFTEKDGLPSSDTWGLFIDSKGVLWVATLQGLAQFEGNRFVPFELPAGEADPSRGVTSDKIVHSIMEDSKGRMWFGVNSGAYMYDGELSNFSETEGLCNNAVNDILEDAAGRIWFATHHAGVCMYDGKSFQHFGPAEGVEGTEVWSLYEDQAGNIWFPVEQYGVYRYDGSSFINYHKEEGLASHAIQCIYQDRRGAYWFGGWLGLFSSDGNTVRSRPAETLVNGC